MSLLKRHPILVDFRKNLEKRCFGLSQEFWDTFVDLLYPVQFKKGDIIHQKGTVSNKSYLLLKGGVSFYYLIDGKKVVNDFSFEGTFVAIFLSRVKRIPSQLSMEAIEDCETLCLDRKDEEFLWEHFKCWTEINFSYAMNNLHFREKREVSFLSETPKERYEYLLAAEPEIFSRAPLYQVASYLGVSPETLSRFRSRS